MAESELLRILIADDNPMNNKLLGEILSKKGICDFAIDGEEALQRYDASIQSNSPYDILLLDIQMPRIDGLDVLREIRMREEQAGAVRRLPIIVITAHEKFFIRSLEAGCNDFLLKPIKVDELLSKLDHYTKS